METFNPFRFTCKPVKMHTNWIQMGSKKGSKKGSERPVPLHFPCRTIKVYTGWNLTISMLLFNFGKRDFPQGKGLTIQ